MITIYSKIIGNGAPLIILHGLFGMGDNWNFIGKKISKYYQVHLIDLRNHGKSIKSKIMDYYILSYDIFNYIKKYNIKEPILIGHSFGGKILMQFLYYFPYIPKKIIIVDIAPKIYNDIYINNIINIISKIDLSKIISRKQLDTFLYKENIDLNTRLLIGKNLYRKSSSTFDFLFYLPGIKNNYYKLKNKPLKSIIYKNPILFIKGEKSDYINDNDIYTIKNFFPHSSIITIKNSGHCIHIEYPDYFIYVILNFLLNY